MQFTHHRILYVDNQVDSCEMMKVLLEMWGYQAELAHTAADGLRLAQRTPFDLYLCETRLPEVSGFELCEQICRVPDHGPVVFISCEAYETDKQRGLQAGASAYLTKPLDWGTLEATLTRLLPKAREKEQRTLLKASPVITTHAPLTMS